VRVDPRPDAQRELGGDGTGLRIVGDRRRDLLQLLGGCILCEQPQQRERGG
jgi:hypothetical protein